jgi:3-keto-5-aminohexanoate cleavage enzyme
MGGNIRTGFEDTLMVGNGVMLLILKISRGKFASSNKELVKHLAQLAQDFGRRLATPAETKKMLGLDE